MKIVLPFLFCSIIAAFGIMPSAIAYEVVMEDLKQTIQIEGEAQTVFTVRATKPLTSKLTGQKIQLAIDKNRSGGTSSRQLTINTGKHKTVAQMTIFLSEIFKHFLDGPVTQGEEFGKIGDVRYGGEIRFVANSADNLRYDIITPEGVASGSNHFDRAEVQAVRLLLTGKTAE